MKPRIAFVLPSFAGGGAERILLTLANTLDCDVFEPVVISFDASGPLRDLISPSIQQINLGHPRLRRAFLPLIRCLRDLSPTCIVSTMAYVNFGVLLARYALRNKTSVLVREANMPAATLAADPSSILFRFLYRFCYPSAQSVICPSHAIAEALQQNIPIPAANYFILRNPVDSERFRAAASVPLRQPGPGRRFIAAGRLTNQKGFDRLLEIFAHCGRDDHLTILGEGAERAALESQAAILGIDANVKFAGFVSEPWPWFSGADAFVLPSRWEGMPNVALEALACGTPVIAMSEAGGIAEIAAASPMGAVTLAESSSLFLAALETVKPDPVDASRKSLLPKGFELHSVALEFQNLLQESFTLQFAK
jgi:glycosyltransferase involved in cell wall biosynthesis